MTSLSRSSFRFSRTRHAKFRRLALVAALLATLAISSTAQAIVSLAVIPSKATAEPGERVAVDVTLSNLGSTGELSMSFEIILPSGIEPFNQALVTGSPANTSCDQLGNNTLCEPGETIWWSVGTLDAGQSVTGTLPPVFSAGLSPGVVSFTGRGLQSGTPLVAVASAVGIVAERRLELTVEEDGSPAPQNGVVDYNLHFGNRSTSTVSPAAEIELTIPGGASVLGASDGGIISGGTVTWPLGDLQPGQGGLRTVQIQTAPGQDDGTLLIAQGRISDTSGQETLASPLLEIDAAEALQLGIEAAPDPASPGEQLAVEVTLTNRGAAGVLSSSFVLRIPEGVEPFNQALVTGSPANTSCDQLGNNTLCEPGEWIWWSVGTLDAGQSVTGTLPPIVANVNDGTVIEFRAHANGGGDARATANRAVVVEADQPLELTLEEDRNPVEPGSLFQYTLHFGNQSATETATNAQIQMVLPAGTSFVTASDGGVLVGDTITWALGSLAPGENGIRHAMLGLTAGPPNGTLVAALARLSSASTDEVRAHSIMEVDADEALDLELVVGPYDPGGAFLVDLTLTNRGAAGVLSSSFVLRIPEGVEPFNQALVTGSPANTSCDQLGNNTLCEPGEWIWWSVGTLDAGESVSGGTPPLVSTLPVGATLEFRSYASGGSDARAADTRAVPEPGHLSMLLAGILGIRLLDERRRRGGQRSS